MSDTQRGRWVKGPSAAMFACYDCGITIQKDEPIRAKNTSVQLEIIHEACYQRRRA